MDEKGVEMKEEMDETLAGLTDKLGKMEQQVSGTVRTVKESVDSVRDTFDLRLHVRRQPWALMAGASALGFLGGYRSGAKRAASPGQRAELASPPPPAAPPTHSTGNGSHGGARAPAAPAEATPGLFANLGEKFEPEIAELKGLVIGTLLGIAREVIVMQATKPAKLPDEANAGDQSPAKH